MATAKQTGTGRRRGLTSPSPAPAAAPSDTAARAVESAGGTDPVVVPEPVEVISSALATVTQSRAVVREGTHVARELLRIARGSSTVVPARGDWRFADPTWRENPVYRRVGQAYLAWSAAMERSGPSTFILSNAGHIQSLVNPPGNPKASYYRGPKPGPDPDEWLASATQHTGSWWECWARWILRRSGTARPAPKELGSDTHPPLAAAPGEYALGAAGA